MLRRSPDAFLNKEIWSSSESLATATEPTLSCYDWPLLNVEITDCRHSWTEGD